MYGVITTVEEAMSKYTIDKCPSITPLGHCFNYFHNPNFKASKCEDNKNCLLKELLRTCSEAAEKDKTNYPLQILTTKIFNSLDIQKGNNYDTKYKSNSNGSKK